MSTIAEQWEDWSHRITNHPPQDPIIHTALDKVTQTFIDTGLELMAVLPEGRELSLTLTKLEEACMWAKASVARNQDQLIPEEAGRPTAPK